MIGQRLVRRVQPDYQVYESNDMETQAIRDTVGYLLPNTTSEQESFQDDLGYQTIPLKSSPRFKLCRGKDTSQTPNGFKGRIGLYEVAEITEEIQQLIVKHATSSQIQKVAVAQGMIPMQVDGYLKALNGLTTIEEVNRVAANIT